MMRSQVRGLQAASLITEATCEACNSYNMLKLTRHLYGWEPDARWFDFYERVQLNHIMAHQRPEDGRFVYFTPLASGARRTFSSPEDSFWCCVGSGLESHAKHADSIFWRDSATLFVNLYIPAALDLGGRDFALDLDTTIPHRGEATLTVRRARRGYHRIALRLPDWTDRPILELNGVPVPIVPERGYAVVRRRWRAGDTLRLSLPMTLRAEPIPGDPTTVAFVSGPVVVAADLGPADAPYGGADPVLVTEAALTAALTPAGEPHVYRAQAALGDQLTMRPFFAQYDRRAAVYFPTFTPERWKVVKSDYAAAADSQRALAARTVDVLYMGEMQPERDHDFVSARGEAVNWNGRSARKITRGDAMSMKLARRPGPAVLRLTLSGRDTGKTIKVQVDGTTMPRVQRTVMADQRWGIIDYPLPPVGEQGRRAAEIVITAVDGDAVVYEMRMLSEAI